MTACCQLHCHSRHSFYDGLTSASDLVAGAAAKGMPGIGLTDHGVVYGAAEFFKACAQHKIQGVIGMEGYEAVPYAFDLERDGAAFKQKWSDATEPRYHHLTIWVATREGWDNLSSMHTLSFQADHKPKNQPLLDRAMLEAHSSGLMIGLGCLASRTSHALATESDPDVAYERAKWYVEVFGDRVYMEVMGNLPEQQALLRPQRKLAKRLGIEVIATNDVHYLHRQQGVENGSHHVMVQGRRWKKKDTEESTEDKSDAGYGQWYGSDGFFLKDGAEMLTTGGLAADEIERTVEVLDRVDFDFAKLPPPSPPVAVIPDPGDDPAFDAWLALAA